MADSLSSPQSLSLNPPKPESNPPPFQPESVPRPITSALTPPSPGLNLNPISNPPTVPSIPTPSPLYAPPAVSGAPLFRPALPQFTPISGAVNYNNPSVSSFPGMANPAAPGPVMPYQVQVPAPVPVTVPRQPPNPALRPYVPVPNGYAAMPPPGLPRYSAPYATVARPAFPPRPPGTIGALPPVPYPPIPGIRPIIPPVVRPGLVPVTPAEKPQTTIYVGKIAPTADNDFMLSLLKLCGPVKSWKRVQDPTDGSLKRFGFCEFESAEGVLRALRLLNKLNLDGQELMLNLNEATKGYLLHYIEKQTENANKEKETEAASVAEKEGDAVPDAEKNDSAKPIVENLKKHDPDAGKNDISESGRKVEPDSRKTEPDYLDFGIVTDEDMEADKEVLEKLTSMINERLKSLPPPPPLAPIDASGIADSEASIKSRERDSDADIMKNAGEDQNDDETTSDNKASSEHDKTDTSSPDRSRHDRRSREGDSGQGLKREKERKIERYEREAERERIRKEREQRRKIEDVEREYEERLRDWEYREREKEKQRQYEREREKERERKRKKEIIYDEEDAEDDSRRWQHRSALEEKKKRQWEKEDDLADRIKEEEEMAEAKERAEEEEKQRLLRREEMERVTDHAMNRNANSTMIEEPTIEKKDEGVSNGGNHIGEEVSQIVSGDGLTSIVGATSDMQNNNNAPPKKLGFGLSGYGKRTAIPSVFHVDDDDEAQKEKKMRPLVPLDYSNEEMGAVQPVAGAPQPNLAAVAEFAKQISSNSANAEPERERSRRSYDRPSQREKAQNYDENKEKGVHREHGHEKSKITPDNKKLFDAKQLIDIIPKTKEDLFSYEVNWALYDQHELHERLRPWVSKKIFEFLGEEEKSLVDYIVSSTREHVKASEMLDTLTSIFDEEAEMFVLKMWRMLIYEIKRVETGLHLRSGT